MMKGPFFKNTIIVSILGHLAAFGIFSFSFGPPTAKLDYPPVFFWGMVLPGSELTVKDASVKKVSKISPDNKTLLMPDRKGGIRLGISGDYLKPQTAPSFAEEKLIYKEKAPVLPIFKRREPQGIMFHPVLPYHFLLFFKDRQAVHVELMFNIVSRQNMNSIIVKRKISSGNLEADLLSMRYISRYLFIEQARFMVNNWQTVKIDLSAKND